MFFLEYFDPEEKKITPTKGFCNNEFILYKYGPFSFEVLEDVDNLKKNGFVKEYITPSTVSIKITNKGKEKIKEIENKVNEKQLKRLKEIKDESSNESGHNLEQLSLGYLGIKEEEKDSLMGIPISVFLIENM